MKVTKLKIRFKIYAPVSWLHAGKNGGVVLRDQASWRTISGFRFYLGRTHYLVEWR